MHRFENDFFRNTGIFRGQKGQVYEGGIRVPMIARWPGQIAAGKVSNFAWGFQDLLPTAAEVAGVAAPAGIDGISVLPALRGGKQKPHDCLYLGNCRATWRKPAISARRSRCRPSARATGRRCGPNRTPRWSCTIWPKDPGEAKDLASSQPALTAELDKRLSAVRTTPRNQTEPEHPWWDVRS